MILYGKLAILPLHKLQVTPPLSEQGDNSIADTAILHECHIMSSSSVPVMAHVEHHRPWSKFADLIIALGVSGTDQQDIHG